MIYHAVLIDFEDQVVHEIDVDGFRDIVLTAIPPKIQYIKDMKDTDPTSLVSIRYGVWKLDRCETELRRMIHNRTDLLYYRRSE